jgi:NitT/TauT family transport system substrate-binding protein
MSGRSCAHRSRIVSTWSRFIRVQSCQNQHAGGNLTNRHLGHDEPDRADFEQLDFELSAVIPPTDCKANRREHGRDEEMMSSRPKARVYRSGVALIFVLLLAASCSSGDDQQASGGDAGSSTTPVTLLLAFPDSIDWTGYYFAQDDGYFSQCGLDVTLKSSSGVSNPTQLLIGGAVDYAIIDPLTYISAVNRGLPIVAIAQDTAHTGVAYWSQTHNAIQGPADLPGQTVGLNPGDDNLWYLQDIMSRELTPDEQAQVNIVPTNFSINPLLTGKVDVMGDWTNDPALFEAENDGFEWNFFKASDYGIEAAGNLLVTTQDKVNENLDDVQRFLVGVAAGLEQATPENADKALDTTIERMGDAAPSREALAKAYANWLELETSPLYEQNGVMWNDPASYEQVQDFLLQNGEISEKRPVDELYSNDVLNGIFTDGKADLAKVCG